MEEVEVYIDSYDMYKRGEKCSVASMAMKKHMTLRKLQELLLEGRLMYY